MKISIITLFPEIFEVVLNTSILKRAQQKGRVDFEIINLRDFGEGTHKVVDSRPYGGGAGMVLKPDVLTKSLQQVTGNRLQGTEAKNLHLAPRTLRTILTSASGKVYKQAKAQELSQLDHLVIICGHYEGVDQRFIDKYVDEEISIGDYVLTGGEIPAMVIVDSITRLIPGVLEKPEATAEESFTLLSNIAVEFDSTLTASRFTLLEYPHFTRPEVFEGQKVPEVLLSGNHQEIAKWRQKQALEKTQKVRPDLLAKSK